MGGIERGMAKFQEVPIDEISRLLGKSYNREEISYWLQRAHKFELIKRKKGAYVGYYLTSMGYDCLALHALVEADVLAKFGKPIGVGKESDVFDALTPGNKRVAVKIHRLGRLSFRQTKRMRSYSHEKKHISWLYTSRLSATREYEALKILHPAGVSVPEPFAHNRHIVVMKIIEGDLLHGYTDLSEPEVVLNNILENIRQTYQAGIIHGDLSEYNLLVFDTSKVLLIDWPQWIRISHPNASYILDRDVKNVLNFFRRKYHMIRNPDEILQYIKEEEEDQ